MLNILRKKKIQKRILMVLAVIITLAFTLWGAGDIRRRRLTSGIVGTIGKQKITLDEFLKVQRGVQIDMVLRFMGQDQILESMLKNRASLNRMAWIKLIKLEEAERRKIRISDKEVVDFITAYPLFLRQGIFDQKFYDYFVSRVLGVKARKFEEHMRELLKISKIEEDALKDVKATDEEAKEAFRKEFEKGKISYIRIDKADFMDEVVVDNSDIERYYSSKRNEFIVPGQVSFSYIDFPYSNALERQELIRIVNPIFNKIKKEPGRFQELAEENRRVVQDSGLFFRNRPPAKFNFSKSTYDVIFGMEKGAIDLFADESASGSLYILRIDDKVKARIKTMDEVRPVIEAKIKDMEADELSFKKAEEVRAFLRAGGNSLEDAKKTFKLNLLRTELISRYDYVDGVGTAFDILDKVFKEKPEVSSEPFKTRKGYIIARLDEFRDIDEAEFEKKKDEYTNRVLSMKKSEAMRKWIDQMSERTDLRMDLARI